MLPPSSGLPAEAFKKDTSPQKLNLGVGAYRTEARAWLHYMGELYVVQLQFGQTPAVQRMRRPRCAAVRSTSAAWVPAAVTGPAMLSGGHSDKDSAVQEGKPLVLDVVKKAEQKIINDPQQNKVTPLRGLLLSPAPWGHVTRGCGARLHMHCL